MSWRFELVVEPYGGVAEGPAWDGTGLLFTQIHACRIMRYDPASGGCAVFRENTNYANGLMFDPEGKLYGCQGGGRAIVRFEGDGETTVLADRYEGKRLNLPNDLAIDLQGRIWFTDPWYEGAAGDWSNDRSLKELDHDSVYRLDPKPAGRWDIARVTFDTTRPNGILFSLDYKTLYVAQSGRLAEEKRQLRAYPVREDGTLGSPDTLHDFGEWRGIDGMTLDTEGNIVATAGTSEGGPGPMIYVFSPSGEALEMHPVPCKKPTNCSFAEEGLSTLYVTSIDGHLFRARTDRQGRLLYPPL
ncbi:MAG: SMP-30/gluconolactonase/LRE family protein [Bryobacteraceae bacterium]|nr:SMP-30/gluconolactonase/LRE family protein [Bryobacteraceae bacterium]